MQDAESEHAQVPSINGIPAYFKTSSNYLPSQLAALFHAISVCKFLSVAVRACAHVECLGAARQSPRPNCRKNSR